MVKKIYDNVLCRFHLIPECHGRTDGRTDRIAVSISRVSVRFPIRLPYSNYGFTLYHFGSKVRYFSKIAISSYTLHSTPPLGMSPSKHCHNVWCGAEKLEQWGCSTVKKSLMIC